MPFRHVGELSPLRDVDCNSPESKSFLEGYRRYIHDSLLPDADYIPGKAFTPSSIRCKRMNWFRLTGTRPDMPSDPDAVLNFISGIGEYCHRSIQGDLKGYLGDGWLDVGKFLEGRELPIGRLCGVSVNGLETKIHFDDPPVHFSCDGLIEYHGVIYLLEIKTSEANSMRGLVAPKSQHMDQVLCYCTLLDVRDAMILYQDRQYGSLKCFTHHVTDFERGGIVDNFKEVLDCVESGIPPERLPKGDGWCNPGYCKYYGTCMELD